MHEEASPRRRHWFTEKKLIVVIEDGFANNLCTDDGHAFEQSESAKTWVMKGVKLLKETLKALGKKD